MAFGQYIITLIAIASIAVNTENAAVALCVVALVYLFPLGFNGIKSRRVYAALDAAFSFAALPVVCVLAFFLLFTGHSRGYVGVWRGVMALMVPVLLMKYIGKRIREARTGDFSQPFPYPTI